MVSVDNLNKIIRRCVGRISEFSSDREIQAGSSFERTIEDLLLLGMREVVHRRRCNDDWIGLRDEFVGYLTDFCRYMRLVENYPEFAHHEVNSDRPYLANMEEASFSRYLRHVEAVLKNPGDEF